MLKIIDPSKNFRHDNPPPQVKLIGDEKSVLKKEKGQKRRENLELERKNEELKGNNEVKYKPGTFF